MLLSQVHLARGRRTWALDTLVTTTLVTAALVTSTRAAEPVRVWQAVPAKPYVLRGAERRLLDGAVRFIKNQQWDDAIDALTRLLESESSDVVDIGDSCFISLQEFCHRLISELPPEPLAKYRMLVDPTADSWYRQAVAEHDATLLQRVVDQHFCSSWGDEALYALGELALQRGEYQQARNAWSLLDRSGAGELGQLTYPDSNLPLATVRARLVLLSFREGDWQFAQQNLDQLKSDFPEARGQLGGREVIYADYLAQLLEEAKNWPVVLDSADWKTLGANSGRTNTHKGQSEAAPWELIWSEPIANDALSIFPIVVNDLVVYQDHSVVYARRLADGEEVFRAEGEDFQSSEMTTGWQGRLRHTLTADNRYVFGVTSSALGTSRSSFSFGKRSLMWGLDLERDGAMVVRKASDDQAISFVGAPLANGTKVFVPICSNDQTARMGIACYDLHTNEWSWQRWLCQSNTPATGWTHEIASNLLTYDSGVIYANTNLGAVAAVRADDGQLMWLRTYKRSSAILESDGTFAYYRAAAPCIFHHGKLYVLPTDGMSLMSLDASTGALVWDYPTEDPMAQLIGVTDERVVLVNNGLQVLDIRSGKSMGQYHFDQLAGWPTLRLQDSDGEVLLCHNQKQGRAVNSYRVDDADTAFYVYQLPERGGANLLVVNDLLIAAGRSRLSVFRNQQQISSAPDESPEPQIE